VGGIVVNWQIRDADGPMRARIRHELTAIRAHMGGEAPPIDTEVSIQVNKSGSIQFFMGGAAYALAPSGVAVCYRPSADGLEVATYWRNGEKVRHIVNPPPAESN
jgi:hypothetical protein